MSRAAIVVNPNAGSAPGRGGALSQRLAERLTARGGVAEPIVFDMRRNRPGTWRQRLEAAIAQGAERVFVLGGDGTVLAVATVLLERDLPLGIVPLGTANLLARDLGLPLQPEEAIDLLPDAVVRRIDVGRVNGAPFLCASMLGLTTALARTREAARHAGPLRLWGRLLRKTITMLGRYPYWQVRLELNGETVALRTRAMVITNNPVNPVPGLFPPRERLDGGLLGVYGVHQGPRWELPRLALRLVNGGWPEEPRIFHYDAPRLGIRARRKRRVTVMNDGERLRLSLPLHYETLPCALPVLLPADSDGVVR